MYLFVRFTFHVSLSEHHRQIILDSAVAAYKREIKLLFVSTLPAVKLIGKALNTCYVLNNLPFNIVRYVCCIRHVEVAKMTLVHGSFLHLLYAFFFFLYAAFRTKKEKCCTYILSLCWKAVHTKRGLIAEEGLFI
jgi:hypothetical protein